jgi:hypothetical protein
LAWMQEDQWEWFIIHTDPYANTKPVFGTREPMFKNMATNFGKNNNEQCPQGPPSK